VQRRQRELSEHGAELDLLNLDFDTIFFGTKLASRRVDRRIAKVLELIRHDPSAPAVGEACAAMAHLSFSRFLHLFKQEVGAPFRSFRTWKRARSLLHYVTQQDANLADVAQHTGYPDSSHFSHSIRQVFGLTPKDVFAGSRKLALHGERGAGVLGSRRDRERAG
jgi:AraC-like DNA-binding protein